MAGVMPKEALAEQHRKMAQLRQLRQQLRHAPPSTILVVIRSDGDSDTHG